VADQKPLSLASKLAEIMAEVENVPKRGHNDHFHYDFATEADVAAAIRSGLAKRHIALLPSLLDWKDETTILKGERGEKSKTITTVKLSYAFVDGETGERFECPWAGRGEDSSDKGLFKAITGGNKYFLLKCFQIPTGDDPENDKQDKQDRSERKARSTQRGDTRADHPQAHQPQPVPTGVNPATGEDESVRVVKVYPRSGRKPCGIEFSDGRKATTFHASIETLALRLFKSAQLCVASTELAKKADGQALVAHDGKPVLNLMELTPIASDQPPIDEPAVNDDRVPF
jgi:hypothetical protein